MAMKPKTILSKMKSLFKPKTWFLKWYKKNHKGRSARSFNGDAYERLPKAKRKYVQKWLFVNAVEKLFKKKRRTGR
jgi:hypothetical protein